MPLGANVVDVAEQAAADLIDRVVVQNAVMPLMADGQDDRVAVGVLRLLGAAGPFPCTAPTVWAISFSVSTCLPARIALNAATSCSHSGRAMITASTLASLISSS